MKASLAMTILLIALGGACGALLRVAIGKLLETPSMAAGFAYGTLAANLLGCLAIGFLYGLLQSISDEALAAKLQPFLIAGFLGSLTTFSTFTLDALRTSDAKGMAMAALYLGLSVGFGVVLCAAGLRLGGASLNPVA